MSGKYTVKTIQIDDCNRLGLSKISRTTANRLATDTKITSCAFLLLLELCQVASSRGVVSEYNYRSSEHLMCFKSFYNSLRLLSKLKYITYICNFNGTYTITILDNVFDCPKDDRKGYVSLADSVFSPFSEDNREFMKMTFNSQKLYLLYLSKAGNTGWQVSNGKVAKYFGLKTISVARKCINQVNEFFRKIFGTDENITLLKILEDAKRHRSIFVTVPEAGYMQTGRKNYHTYARRLLDRFMNMNRLKIDTGYTSRYDMVSLTDAVVGTLNKYKDMITDFGKLTFNKIWEIIQKYLAGSGDGLIRASSVSAAAYEISQLIKI